MHILEKDISAYLEHSLAVEKQIQLEKHFLQCCACRRKLEEWESLYDTIGELEYDFELEGLESIVLQRIAKEGIKTAEKHDKPFKLVLNTAAVLLLLLFAGLVFSPVTDFAGVSFKYASTSLFNEGLNLFNELKWHAVDFISLIQDINLTDWLFTLTAGIILICGGTYFSFFRRAPEKA